MNKREIVFIGIGRFTLTLINDISKKPNFSIVAIDKDEKKLELLQGIKNIIVGDATDKDFLLNIGIENADFFVIGMGQDFQSSLIIASLLKENFKGKVIAKSVNDRHEIILNKIGVDEVVTPEVEAAKKEYRKLINPLSFIGGAEEYQITEINKDVFLVRVPVIKKQYNKKIVDIKIPNGILISLVFKKNDNNKPIIANGDTLIEEGDVLALIGTEANLNKIINVVKKDIEKNRE
ncbi:MAG: potassium transporter Trk [Candidatus Tyloplasma litorale]|nr:MAG: potassium transporter Trk [Mycoplasmatales bacterium]